MKDSVLREKSKKFAIEVVQMYKFLRENEKESVMSKQVLRSGTSIGVNICESYYAQSSADFINKLSISLKEAAETDYWLDLLISTDYISKQQYGVMHDACVEIIKILTASINTAKKNADNN